MGMTWRPVSFAGLTRQLNCVARASYHRFRRILEADLVIAIRTEPKPMQSLPAPLEQSLHARAMRLHNREPRAIAQYMQTHQILHRGR
jgi:adenosine deaminase